VLHCVSCCDCVTPNAHLQSWLNDAANTFSGVNGSFSAGYALLTAALLGAGLGYIVAPSLTLQGVSDGGNLQSNWRVDQLAYLLRLVRKDGVFVCERCLHLFKVRSTNCVLPCWLHLKSLSGVWRVCSQWRWP
jgi:hypothetical protein